MLQLNFCIIFPTHATVAVCDVVQIALSNRECVGCVWDLGLMNIIKL